MASSSTPMPSAGIWKIDPVHTSLQFSARHMMFSKVRGEFSEFEGVIEVGPDLEAHRVEVTINAASITTGEEKRDTHLRSADFLDADNYKELKFRSKKIETYGDKWRLLGGLTIRGITKDVTLDFQYNGAGVDPFTNEQVCSFSASTQINRKDFGLEWNFALEAGGFLVGDDVDISLEIEARKQ